MLVYEATKGEFLDSVLMGSIKDEISFAVKMPAIV